MVIRPNGRYELRLPRAGSFRIRVERLGYTPGLSPAVAVGVGDSMGVDLSLRAAAVALDSVEVEARGSPTFAMPGHATSTSGWTGGVGGTSARSGGRS